MARKIKLYLAGPFGFSEAGRAFYYDKLIPLIKQSGYEPIDPWTLTPKEKIERVKNMPYGPEKRDAWKELNLEIGSNNESAIKHSDGVIAVLDGPDVDSGTAAEVGYAYGKGKRIIGYRGDFRFSSENEGGLINIQVEYFIYKSGGTIVTSLDAIPAEIEARFVE